MPELMQTVLWRWIRNIGMERFELVRAPDGWALRGTIVASVEGGPVEARYEVFCEHSWRTTHANITLWDGTGERVLRLVVQDGQWHANGIRNEAVEGCTDIDLEWSPSTNTIPIRRLGLAVGERSGCVIGAWVRFPSLTLQPLSQEYERISERQYRYICNEGEFIANITVDEMGVVVDYEGLWQRVVAKRNV
jgi:uncharacterized protein